MVAFTTRMPAGIPGAITRPLESTVEPGRLIPAAGVLPIPEYGLAAYYDTTTKGYRLPTTGDTPALVTALVRPYPGGRAQSNGVLGVAPVDYDHVGDVLKRGYMSVRLNNGTAAKNGTVYVRIAAPAGAKVIGGFEATADGANTLTMPHMFFMGPAFSDSTFGAMTEIAINIV